VNEPLRDRVPRKDIDWLPAELASQSIAETMLILPLDAALRVVAVGAEQGRRLESWEGWVQLPDGGRAKSLAHSGSFALPRDAAAAAKRASDAMRSAQERWDRDPEYVNAKLFFGLTFARPESPAS
jgi:hypothetical protein